MDHVSFGVSGRAEENRRCSGQTKTCHVGKLRSNSPARARYSQSVLAFGTCGVSIFAVKLAKALDAQSDARRCRMPPKLSDCASWVRTT